MTRILIVEDEPMLLMAYEDAAADLGHEAVTAATLGEGMALAGTTPEAAILDIRLGEERVFPLADLLKRLGVPFLFCSGTVEDMTGDSHRDVPLIRKPADPRRVVRQAAALAAGCGADD